MERLPFVVRSQKYQEMFEYKKKQRRKKEDEQKVQVKIKTKTIEKIANMFNSQSA